MKTTSIFGAILAAAGAANAQYHYVNGQFTCDQPNAAYCAGNSLGTDIIIRCIGTVGHPGRCSDVSHALLFTVKSSVPSPDNGAESRWRATRGRL
jgi:hypothetical protein